MKERSVLARIRVSTHAVLKRKSKANKTVIIDELERLLRLGIAQDEKSK